MRKLEDRSRSTMFTKLQSCGGMEPSKPELMVAVTSLVSLPKDDGMGPLKLSPARKSDVRSDSWPHEEGAGPLKKTFVRVRDSNFSRLPKVPPTTPVYLQSDRHPRPELHRNPLAGQK